MLQFSCSLFVSFVLTNIIFINRIMCITHLVISSYRTHLGENNKEVKNGF